MPHLSNSPYAIITSAAIPAQFDSLILDLKAVHRRASEIRSAFLSAEQAKDQQKQFWGWKESSPEMLDTWIDKMKAVSFLVDRLADKLGICLELMEEE